jgi:hypothetical protein
MSGRLPVLGIVPSAVLLAACGLSSGGGPRPAPAIPGITAGDLKVNLQDERFYVYGAGWRGHSELRMHLARLPGVLLRSRGNEHLERHAVVLGGDSAAREFSWVYRITAVRRGGPRSGALMG